MYIEDFKDIMTKIESDFRSNEQFLKDLRLVDYSASEFVSENQYSNTYACQCDYLQRMLFGEELFEWVSWYLYEKDLVNAHSSEPNVELENGVKYQITHLNSFVDFVQQELGLKQRPIGIGNENKDVN
jgi:hypothetical protein